MRILLLASAFNGLTQRTWIELRRAKHEVAVELAINPKAIREAVHLADPELIVCPFLKERVPDDVWANRRTIIVHPGPVGDRGPSSLDWAILDGERTWGVTALQAVHEMDAGPVWSTRAFALPTAPESPATKSALYNGPVADAAIGVVHDVVAKAADPSFEPVLLDAFAPEQRQGRLRPMMRAEDRRIDWDVSTTDEVLRIIAASDGSPGAPCTLAGHELRAFDAHPVPAARRRWRRQHGAAADDRSSGLLPARRDGAVRVSTADGAVWIGHLSRPGEPKLPARDVLADHVQTVDTDTFASLSPTPHAQAPGDICYRRIGAIGWISFDFYNGAMSTDHCRRLLAAFSWAQQQDTRVIVLRGGDNAFSNGIHLNVIEKAPNPATAAWANIEAMDDLCRAIITCTEQLVVAGVSGNAGAGGVMMSLGADVVAARCAVVLNPHYAAMGLFGSEYWTYTLPRRVGPEAALELTERCLPVGDREALRLGLVDRVCSRDPARYNEELLGLAEQLAGRGWADAVGAKARRREAEETALPLEAYRARELSRMAADFFEDDRHARLRHAFLAKERPTATPANIALHRSDRPTASRP